MYDSLVDDIKELLDKERGDKRILEQILRASENDEVISNFERNYVQKLSEKYLNKKPPVDEKPSQPDVKLLDEQTQEEKPLIQESKPKPIKPKNKILFVGMGVAALAIIIVAAVAFSGMPDLTSPSTPQPTNTSTTPTVGVISLQTDLPSYSRGDIISINGKSDSSLGGQILLSIENQDGKLAWSENVNVKSNGEFSTLLIAGGDEWRTPGTFTLKADHGTESETVEFSFTN